MASSSTSEALSAASAQPEVVPEEFVQLANRLADAAGEIITQYFRLPINIEDKADFSPVTVADRAAERAMRQLINEAFPSHGVFGEEEGSVKGSDGGEYVWVLDPIDGTKAFITGKPTFGTLIALLRYGVPVLGIIDQPVSQERWVGAVGTRTTLNSKPIAVRPCPGEIGSAYMYSTTPHMFSGKTEEAFFRVRDAVRLPLYGCDCYAYGLLAAGFVDVVLEASLQPYDYLALVPIIEGAGGVITDWLGRPLRWREGDDVVGEVVAAGDVAVHAEALRLLNWTQG
eukprot:jgi/Chlat1/5827/Chrsp4S06353